MNLALYTLRVRSSDQLGRILNASVAADVPNRFLNARPQEIDALREMPLPMRARVL
jgi:hypothetical protein